MPALCQPVQYVLTTPTDTAQFAGQLAQGFLKSARASSSPFEARIYLEGDLGTGKTTWVRALLRALGVQGPVTSPTYSLLNAYDTALGPVQHLDLYRIAGIDELAQSGLLDELEGPGLHLVEWPQQAGPGLPPPDMRMQVTLMPADEPQACPRLFTLEAFSSQGLQWLAWLPPPSAA
jgi:tRNA threonylcarbamoyladenosine biosynthesis protein TsaE